MCIVTEAQQRWSITTVTIIVALIIRGVIRIFMVLYIPFSLPNAIYAFRENRLFQSHISKIMNGKDLYLSTAQDIAMAVGEKVDYLWPIITIKKDPSSQAGVLVIVVKQLLLSHGRKYLLNVEDQLH